MTTLDVVSADGTRISADSFGAGPALILVHGIAGDAARWAPVRGRLAEHFTVHAMARRGRGRSEDAASYAIEREIEDVVALADAIEGETLLFGHSFGGLLALEAAARAARIGKLLVYEPYAPETPVSTTSAATASFLAMGGDREGILLRFLADIVLMPAEDIARFRATKAWDARLAAAHTIPREMAAVEQHAWDGTRLAARAIPTRFLLGTNSPAFIRDATQRMSSVLPTCDVVPLAEQGHIAMDTAPTLFVDEVCRFFGV